jgi:hypothetical protein
MAKLALLSGLMINIAHQADTKCSRRLQTIAAVSLLIARMLNPCRFNSSISYTSFPVTPPGPPPLQSRTGISLRHGVGDFSSGTMGILRPALTRELQCIGLPSHLQQVQL